MTSSKDVVALSHCDVLGDFCELHNLQFRTGSDLPSMYYITSVGCSTSNSPCFLCNVVRRRTKRKADNSQCLTNEDEFYSPGEPRLLDDLEIDSGLRQLASQLGYVTASDIFFPTPLHSLLFINRFIEKVLHSLTNFILYVDRFAMQIKICVSALTQHKWKPYANNVKTLFNCAVAWQSKSSRRLWVSKTQ